MSDNKFIERLKGKETAKSVLEVKNQATKLSFANMPQGTSNAIDVFSDHRGNATAVLNGTTNWKISNSNLLLATTVSGDGQDFLSTYSVSGTGLWVNASYTFPSTGDPRHPIAMVFNPSTKWVLKVCGDNLIVDGGSTIDFTMLVKIGTANVYSKNFTVRESAGQFSKEFVIDFGEANLDIVKAGGLSTLTVQLLCGTANASARIYNGMSVLTCLQRKVDASAVSNNGGNVEDVLNGNMIPTDYFSNPAFIDQIEDGDEAYAVFTRDGDNVDLSGWAQPIPDQANNNGKFLTTDGSDMSWEQIDISDVDGLQNALNAKANNTNRVNGAPLSNTASVFYGTSTTAAATVQKEVSIPSITTLDTGTIIIVQPTVTSTVANSTLKLNDFPAYPMRYNNAAITTSTDSTVWSASFPSIWVFDGTYWVFAGHGVDSNTTYSAMSVAEGTTGTATSNRVMTAANTKQIIQGTTLTGIDVATTGAVSASDTITEGIGKLQATKADKSELPTVGDGTITITQGGVSKGTFTTNQSGNTTIALDAGGGGAVDSVNGKTGVVVLTATDVGALPDSTVIPTVNNPTITITQGGVTKGSFTLNQSTGDTIALDAGGGGSVDIDNSTITKNVSDELQAVATINANTAAGATNPIYDWVGTLAEYNAQNIESLHPDWMCYITDDVSGGLSVYTKTQVDNLLNAKVAKGHEVIAFQAPTSGNNYTWYRKYADGWVEMGGCVTGFAQAANTQATAIVILPVTLSSVSNSVLVSFITDGGNSTGLRNNYNTLTTTSLTIGLYTTTSITNNYIIHWEVKGMAA